MPSEDSKPVKEEVENDDEDDRSIGSLFSDRKKKDAKIVKREEALEDQQRDSGLHEKKPANAASKSRPIKAKAKKEAKGKEDDGEHDEPLVGKKAAKADKLKKKKKKRKDEEKNVAATGVEKNIRKRVKKVYDMPGQKRDPPEERDPLRIFYETLYKQMPNSEMAAFWLMESGLLSKEEAKKANEKKQKRSLQQKLTSPVKVVTVKKNSQSITVKRKTQASSVSSNKRTTTDSRVTLMRKNEPDSDDDFTLNM